MEEHQEIPLFQGAHMGLKKKDQDFHYCLRNSLQGTDIRYYCHTVSY